MQQIVEGFMVQLGCPHSVDPKAANAGEGAPPPGSSFTILAGPEANSVVVRGTVGDESGCIPDEHDAARISNTVGTLAMANNDKPNTGGSQFFINVADNPMLNFWDDSESESKHPVFGKVIGDDGLDVIRRIAKVATDDERPSKPIKVTRIRIL
jgi:cyclophilin family peptidyl-prolyl cis-trans isomerase